VAIVPAMLFVANNLLETMIRVPALRAADPFYGVFLGAVASQLALVVRHTDPAVARGGRTSIAVRFAATLGAFLLVVPLGLLVSAVDRRGAATDAVAVVLCAVLTHALVRWLAMRTEARFRNRGIWILRLQTLSVAIAAALVLPWSLR
jgi:hypothetical protein